MALECIDKALILVNSMANILFTLIDLGHMDQMRVLRVDKLSELHLLYDKFPHNIRAIFGLNIADLLTGVSF